MILYLSAHMMHLLSVSDAVKFDLCSLKCFACQEHLLGTLMQCI